MRFSSATDERKQEKKVRLLREHIVVAMDAIIDKDFDAAYCILESMMKWTSESFSTFDKS